MDPLLQQKAEELYGRLPSVPAGAVEAAGAVCGDVVV